MSNRNHPIRQMLDEAARGQKPSREDLAKLDALSGEGVPGRWIQAEVKKAAAAIVNIRADGYMGYARRQAAAFTEDIVSRLPGYEGPTPRGAESDDPRELADIVRGDGPDAQAIRDEIKNIPRI